MSLNRHFCASLLIVCCVQLNLEASSGKSRPAASAPNQATVNFLELLSTSLQSVAKQVEPSVVQIFNCAYAIEAENDRDVGTVVSQQRSSGSGILVSSDGFIVTNAHVVADIQALHGGQKLSFAVPVVERAVGLQRLGFAGRTRPEFRPTSSTHLLNFPGRKISERVGQLAACSLSSGTRKMENEM